MKNDFYVVLPSNSCPLTRPYNNASDFIVDYESPIRLDGNWQVALTEFSCIYSPLSLIGANRIKYKKKEYEKKRFTFDIFQNNIKAQRDDPKIDIQLSKIGIVEFKYNNELFSVKFDNEYDAIYLGMGGKGKDFKLLTHSGLKKVTDVDYINISGWIETNLSTTNQFSIIFKGDILFNNIVDLIAYFKEHCSHVFRDMKVDHNNIISFSLQDDIIEVELDEKFRTILGFNKSILTSDKSNYFKGVKRPKLKLSFDHMYIYSSIVEPVYVGNYRVPLLKNVWLENKSDYMYGDVIYVSLENPMYLPVSTFNINKIEINIRDDSGTFVKFSLGSKTSLTLHFRKT